MKKAAEIRNFVVAGHSGSGKTSLCDLMLYKAGAVARCGSVTQKNSVSDYTPDEQEKQSSIYSAALNCEWKGNQFFFVDTPGYGEFIGETIAPINAADSTLVVVDAVEGIQVGTLRSWKNSRKLGNPRLVLINRVDCDRADFNRVLRQLQEAYGKTVCVPVTLPVGSESNFSKVVNVLRDTDIPDEVADDAAKYKEMLMDTIAESDETLMEKYLEGEILTDEEIARGLHSAIVSGDLVPVYAASVSKDIGIEKLMDSIGNLFPSPLDKGTAPLEDGEVEKISEKGAAQALVFKSIVDPFIGQLTFFRVVSGIIKSDSEYYNVSTGAKERFGTIMIMNGKEQKSVDALGPGGIGAIAKLKHSHIGNTIGSSSSVKALRAIKFPNPVMSYSISAVKSGEEDKIGQGLNKLTESDPTIKVGRDKETHEMLLRGMGDQHLGNVVKKLKDTYKVNVKLDIPKVAYRETIMANGEGHYRHKKQTGGAGQFAEVYLRITPNNEGYEFENKVVGGNIPRNFIPAVEKGVSETLVKGPLVGCRVEDVKVTVYDGKYHPVDSNEMAFKIASRMAFRDAMAKAKPVLLEPIMDVKIMIPDEYMGDVSGDLNHKRGRILGMGIEEGLQVVNAEVPLAEMAKYATELRSMTQGRGVFEMDFSRYEQVPTNVANEIINAHQIEQESE
ncbi:MAG: elongation factor G [Lentisphaerae bacterium]|nr:elongation factor G [Lentisphaerota bacterium]MCP4102173.1 elongation factor G [Lentisphaerota bacterium]